MIKHFPKIYPGELFYSYLSRIACHNGFLWHMGIAREILKNPSAGANYNYINILKDDFRRELERYIPIEQIALKHTLFKYYAVFLPYDKKNEAFEIAIKNNRDLSFFHLPIPNNKRDYYLRYCPMCVKEDREEYGECYFHLEHQIPEVKCCFRHGVKLIDTKVLNERTHVSSFVPLELLVGELNEIKANAIEVEIARYIAETIKYDIDLEVKYPIGSWLSDCLEDKYFSPRGEQKQLDKIMGDLQYFYRDFGDFNINKRRLATIYRNDYINVFDIFLIALFERIPPRDLVSFRQTKQARWEVFDEKVKELKAVGLNNAQIAAELKVNHEVVRQILLGTYDKPKNNKARYKCQKWDWEAIDLVSCKELDRIIEKKPLKVITKSSIAAELGLNDKSLRNLPKLKERVKHYKNLSKVNSVRE